MNSLFFAARFGNLEKVKTLISAGYDVDAKDEDGKTALLCSAAYNHADVVKELIAAGADVNATEDGGKSALHYSADNGHSGIVKALIAAGADVNAREKDGWTPLFYNAHTDCAEITRALIAAGAVIDTKDDESEKTPLHYSADNGHSNVVEALIAAGADWNAKEVDGNTPLHYSTYKGHSHIMKLFIAAGSDISEKDVWGSSLLDIARTEMKMVLIKYALLYQDVSNRKPELKYMYKRCCKFWNKCENQVKTMKETWLGASRISFFKFITETDQNKLAFYSTEQAFGIGSDLERVSYIEKFSIYAEDIEDQFEKGRERAKLLHESQELMTQYFRYMLPQEITRKISEYMSNDDLEDFLILRDVL